MPTQMLERDRRRLTLGGMASACPPLIFCGLNGMTAALTMASPDIRCIRLTDHPAEILSFVREAVAEGQGCALVTLIDIVDGAARALGAHMAVRADGAYCGFVSGGCVEASVAAEAIAALDEGHDRLTRYGKGSDFFDIVLPCGGGIGLAIHVVRDLAPILGVLGHLAARQPVALSYDTANGSGNGSLSLADPAPGTGWQGGRFVVSYRPALRIILIGQGMEGQIFARIAAAADVDLVRDDKSGKSAAAADPFTAVVMLRHDVESEVSAIRHALESEAFYIGCLGSRQTHQTRLKLLRAAGITEPALKRIHAPIGLFGPARDAAAIAVSVLAEVMMYLNHIPLTLQPVGRVAADEDARTENV